MKPTKVWPPRSYLHNIFALAGITAVAWFWYPVAALAFGIGYVGHLFLDALDHTNLRVFFPFSNRITNGPIKYNSFGEHTIAVGLLIGYAILYA